MRFNLTMIVLLGGSCMGYAQKVLEMPPAYYVVVAAYAPAKQTMANRFVQHLKQEGLEAAVGLNSARGYLFVYLNHYNSLKESLVAMRNARQHPKFPDAWVRVIKTKVDEVDQAGAMDPRSPVEETAIAQKESTDLAVGINDDSRYPAEPIVEGVVTFRTEEISVDVEPDSLMIENPPIKQYDPITLANTEVFLSLFNASNNRVVEGDIKVIDPDRGTLLKEVKGNDYLHLPDPKNKSGQVTLICEAFGYRKFQTEINYPLPLADTAKNNIDLVGTTFMIGFDLVRYRAGDLVTLFHVYFFNDAAIMMPESKYELTSLVEMLKENLNYQIRLHGHTNGHYHGRIIKMGPDKNFFSLAGSQSAIGSAKDLSYNRAEVIKQYLVNNGVDESRITVKAWGGKRALYDKHGANARKNVRVEVEILED